MFLIFSNYRNSLCIICIQVAAAQIWQLAPKSLHANQTHE